MKKSKSDIWAYVFICLIVIFAGVSAYLDLFDTPTNKTEYDQGYDDGYAEAKWYYSDKAYEMYFEGYQEAYWDFVDEIVFEKAVEYATGYSEYHPEEAMCIILCREKGRNYCNGTRITNKVYEEAVASLCHYYEYFCSGEHENAVDCDYKYYD